MGASLTITSSAQRRLMMSVGLGCVLLAAGCAKIPVPDISKIPTPGVYKLDIQQGNVIDEAMLARLEPGMEKRQVRFLLGTPLVTDVFDENRWDYLYSFQEGGGKRVQRNVTVVFEDDLLARVEGDIPTDGFTPPVDEPERIVTVPDQPPDNLLGRITTMFDDKERLPLERKPAEDDLEGGGLFGGWFGGGGEKIVHPSKQDPAENEAEDQVESTAQELQDEQLDSNLSDADEQSETAQDETFVTDTAAEQTDSQVSAEEDELGFFERLNNKYGVDETPTAANEDRN